MDPIIYHLKNSQDVLLATHTNPDGDAIGSIIAMGIALHKLNKRIFLYSDTSIPEVYRFLPSVNLIQKHIDTSGNYKVAVILDCGDLSRIGPKAEAIVKQIPVTINIDHHITNTLFGNYQRIDTSACATAEIVYHIIRELGVTIDRTIATSIYTGILTDTGSFRFTNTNGSAFSICEEMVKLGVRPSNIAQHVYGTYSLGRLKLLNLALESIEISKNGKFSVMTLTQDMLKQTGTSQADADGLINYARRIEDVKVAILIQERNTETFKADKFPDLKPFHVSLRSDGSVDVSQIAATFGGGGHVSAAGFNIEASLDDIKTYILNLSKKL